MKRRAVVALGAALAGNTASLRAQPRVARIGLLSFGSAPSGASPDPIDGFARGLREQGFVAGRNVVIEPRYAEGRPERLATQTAELVALDVAVIVAGGPAPLAAARRATATIPIVAVSGADPIAEGWAQSLARPGGNVTGLTVTFPELGGKRLELLREAVPRLARVALLYAPADLPNPQAQVAGAEAMARQLGLQLQAVEIGGAGDLDAVFERIRAARSQALLAFATNIVATHRDRLAALASAARLPSVSDFALLMQAGFLMSYGADLDDLIRRAASYVAKILGGTRPGELAIERPSKFALGINLKTAAAIGLAIPQSLLLRADEVVR
jgi:putative tryptophan/tyrosine transport system substrate-binding protein